jgi:hypothetical protein
LMGSGSPKAYPARDSRSPIGRRNLLIRAGIAEENPG